MPHPLTQRVACSIAALLCSAGSVLAAGPDVIVGEIPDVSNYTTGGAVGGKRAYAIGTTSCNIGDAALSWISSTNQHPVISENLYRLSGGRFEQIGQSWLKHGFTALQGAVCASCSNPNPNGSALAPGCSDPYSSGLNGGQGPLGPKSEVNASTGFFPYPHGNGAGAACSDAVCKRLQVNDTDLGIAGASYFVSAMYVQPQDATGLTSGLRNNTNSASYRPVSISGAGRTMALTGSTVRGAPPVQAWKDVDPTVTLTTIDVPAAGSVIDGRFIIASKATNLGGGLYHYEYAVMNLTSDRSGGSFSVPVPAGAVVSGIGFHDVDYWNENYSGTDWTGVYAAGSVTWTCPQTFAQNANANALRWDTTYTFRFDCDRVPSTAAASIGLFKPVAGGVGLVAGVTVAPSSTGGGVPTNDNCNNVVAIGDGTQAFLTTSATDSGGNVCGGTAISKDVWYLYTANACATGSVTISTCGSGFDTKIAVYPSGNCPPAAGSEIACNDNAAPACTPATASSVTFNQTAGTSYLLRVGGAAGASGSGSITIAGPSCPPPVLQPPVNDLCAGSLYLADNVARTGNTDGTATQAPATFVAADGPVNGCNSSDTSPDVWFIYFPQTAGTVTVTTCNSGYDTNLSAYTGSCGSLVSVPNACNDDTNQPGCGAVSNLVSQVTFTAVAGTRYHIRVAGYQGLTGAYTVKASGAGGIIPPANDDCAGRPGITLGTTVFSTVGTTTDGITHAACSFFGNNQITNDIWFNYPSLCDGELTVSTCGSNFDTKVAIYDDRGCTDLDARLLACGDDVGTTACPGNGNATILTIPVVSHRNYTIRVGGYNGAFGAGTLTLGCNPWCPGDWNHDRETNGNDISAFINSWYADILGGTTVADFNADGETNGNDISDYINTWYAEVANGGTC